MLKKLFPIALLAPSLGVAEPVTLGTFVRAETDHMFRANMAAFDVGIGELIHVRKPTTPDNQPVIRMNQDTLYSGIVLDLSDPVEFTLPDLGERYISMHVINQDHYMFVETAPGTYKLTEENVGTRFGYVTVRIFMDANDPEDVAEAHAAQDSLILTGGGVGPFEAPDWDLDDLTQARMALSNLAELGFSSFYSFGTEEETRPIDHLVGTAAGWGGLPRTAALYEIDSVDANDGETPHSVTVNEVPVNAFWSITIYNADGYLEANDLGRNSLNNVTAEANADGSITINFGACEDGRVNCIPITSGWNYTVRLYEPREEILNGNWSFPAIEPTE
ncbi:DUF1214 domain-containing protein [Ruegeria sp. HKCCA5014]|uniref:DUF1214 domain-containing protein n=1 Tax=Ruegeria sp. HKCCA5014 TaxID=2682980 RepID=UPI0014876A44|nr:DUF1214 domain-containing protein [Ruegeria sp. HKCCA5014]